MASKRRLLYLELKPALQCMSLAVTTGTNIHSGEDRLCNGNRKIECQTAENLSTFRNDSISYDEHTKFTLNSSALAKEPKPQQQQQQQQQESRLTIYSDSLELNYGSGQIQWDLSCLSQMIRVDGGDSLMQRAFMGTLSLRLPTIEKIPSIPIPKQSHKSQSNLVSQLSENTQLVCVQCGTLLLLTSECQRVLPLPSTGWKDIADDWFCHQHSGDNSQSNMLSPRTGDLLVGRYTSLVKRSMLVETAVDVKDEKTLTCHCCGSILGSIVSPCHLNGSADGAPVEIHHDKLGVALSDTEPRKPLILPEETVASHLLDHCKAMMTYKFVLESTTTSGKATPTILVWVLETDIQLLLADDCGDVDCFNALKTLYLPVFQTTTRLVSDWLKDNRVSSIQLPETVCQYVQTCLTRSSKLLPTSIANEMHVGFLRL